MKFNKNTFEIIFFARGGQGAKAAAEILAQAANREGKFAQAFPQFGPERSGAPTKTFVRLSDTEIRTHEPIIDPDVVAVLDETLVLIPEVIKNLDRRESLIINSRKDKNEFRRMLPDFKGNIYPIDANGLSFKIIGQPRPNIVILGKLAQITEIARLESIIEEFRKIFFGKIGKDATEKNVLAIREAYDTI